MVLRPISAFCIGQRDRAQYLAIFYSNMIDVGKKVHKNGKIEIGLIGKCNCLPVFASNTCTSRADLEIKQTLRQESSFLYKVIRHFSN